MSIYLVVLSKWYPFGEDRHDIAVEVIRASRCPTCRSRIRWKRAVGHHSVPFGCGDVFCSWKCAHSNKVAKPDKRYERRLCRKWARMGWI